MQQIKEGGPLTEFTEEIPLEREPIRQPFNPPIRTVNVMDGDDSLTAVARDFVAGPQGATAAAGTTPIYTATAATQPQQQQSDELPAWVLPVGIIIALCLFGGVFKS